ncbi:kinase [Pseudonocardia sp. KRD291]|uniref:kinase n=1 Tax=Pseudonocardia sp. KRD291 TaxID=2792007 RepID=UPI001C49F7CE|nr:kinase [Pseudonocardia sp. KRD291]MBW0105801.1 kinase [Pseudonocardia sp. KRD291]
MPGWQSDGRGLVLFGPPAAGKDTVTAALTTLDPRHEHFQPLKAGPGRTSGYRMSNPRDLDRLRARDGVVWTTRRYGAQYVVDVHGLAAILDRGRVPILHLAEPAALDELAVRFPDIAWHVVLLSCPRDVAEQRIRARATGDAAARLAAYDAFQALEHVDQRVDTAALTPEQAAAAIAASSAVARPR